MITYRRAQTVAIGEKVASRQWNSLARGMIDRLLSGVSPWRIVYQAWGLMRQIRNPRLTPGIGQWPTQDEWLRVYALLNPRTSSAEWPVADPGFEEGINLANPMGAFVFGNAGMNLYAEDMRVADGDEIALWPGMDPPTTLDELRAVGKAQRGVFDPDTGEYNTPVLRAAREHQKIAYSSLSHYLKAYGGFLPTRLQCATGCGDAKVDPATGYEYGETPRFYVVFTPTAAGAAKGLAVKNYTGFCPAGSPGASGVECNGPAIAWIGYGDDYYFIYQWNESGGLTPLESLARADYIEGPYTGGGQIARDRGRQIEEAMHYFAHNFRGDTAQRASEEWDPEETAFDAERFFANQLLLAPALGQSDGLGGIDAVYPVFRFNSSAAAGSKAASDEGGQTLAVRTGFVWAGFYIKATGLNAPVTIKALDKDIVAASVTLTPDEAHEAGAIKYFISAAGETSGGARGGAVIAFELGTALDLAPGGAVYIEVDELWAMKPSQEIYVVLRAASSKGGFGTTIDLDTDGIDLASPSLISDNYFSFGMIYNGIGAGLTTVEGNPIQQNPIYESARRLITDNMRLAGKENLIGYEVVNGKSVLYYQRYAAGMVNEGFDIFLGLADEIRQSAPSQGGTNRWCLFFSVDGSRDDPNSLWKPEIYDASIVLHNRCLTLSSELVRPLNADLNQHFTQGMKYAFLVEAPTEYTYARGINGQHDLTPAAQTDHYRSCQIYALPYEVESVQSQPDNVVKVTLKTRLRHSPEAESHEIINDPSTWGWVATDPSFRTDEDAAMEWLRKQALGINCRALSKDYGGFNYPWQVGDMAARNDLYKFTDQPYGACLLRSYFVRLPRELAEDGDDDQHPDRDAGFDSDDMIQMEFYLRAICGAFIDDASTRSGCELGSQEQFYDFTFENLIFQAAGRSSLAILPDRFNPSARGWIGPLPRTGAYADVYNQFAQMLNRLTKLRVMLPFTVECRTSHYEGQQAIGGVWPEGATCTGTGELMVVWSGSPPAAGTLTLTEDWIDCGDSVAAASSSAITENCQGENFTIGTTRQTVEFKVTLEAGALEAVPSEWRNNFDEGAGFFGFLYTAVYQAKCLEVQASGDADGCCHPPQEPCPGFFWSEGKGYACENDPVSETTECRLFRSGAEGILDPGTPLGGTFKLGRTSDNAIICTNGSGKTLGLTLAKAAGMYLEVPLI